MTYLPTGKWIVTAAIVLFYYGGAGSISAQQAVKQGPPVPVSFCIDPAEMILFQRINKYRQQYNLPPVPLSKSLSYVAALHAKDLFLHHPDEGSCNSHSWSGKGFWLPFCYPGDETKKNSVWDKPRELTKYPSRAYEIVYWENNPLVTDTVMMVWKTEEYFNNFLLSTGKWQGKTWNAIGIAVYENYACAWFGEVRDPEEAPVVCGSKPLISAADTLPLPKPDSGTVRNNQPVVSTDNVTPTYFIIVKTNLSREASHKLVAKLKAGSYPDAEVLEKEGKIRVSAFKSADRAVATTKLKEVRKTYKDAWLLKTTSPR